VVFQDKAAWCYEAKCAPAFVIPLRVGFPSLVRRRIGAASARIIDSESEMLVAHDPPQRHWLGPASVRVGRVFSTHAASPRAAMARCTMVSLNFSNCLRERYLRP
jgi:hypothetical protein